MCKFVDNYLDRCSQALEYYLEQINRFPQHYQAYLTHLERLISIAKRHGDRWGRGMTWQLDMAEFFDEAAGDKRLTPLLRRILFEKALSYSLMPSQEHLDAQLMKDKPAQPERYIEKKLKAMTKEELIDLALSLDSQLKRTQRQYDHLSREFQKVKEEINYIEMFERSKFDPELFIK